MEGKLEKTCPFLPKGVALPVTGLCVLLLLQTVGVLNERFLRSRAPGFSWP